MDRVTGLMAALGLATATGAAFGQAVYKCRDGSYSDQNCSSRVVRTYEAPVPVSVKPRDGAFRMLPGETVAEFNVRKRRGHLKETDRDECARLDKRIPVEEQRLNTPHEEQIDDAQMALDSSRKRFRKLGC